MFQNQIKVGQRLIQLRNYKNWKTILYIFSQLFPMLIELKNMIECFEKLQHAEHQEYIEQMNEICLNPANLLNFRVILSDPHIQSQTKKMAAVFFKNYFVERYCDFQEVFFIELVMGIVMDEKVPYQYKVLIEQTIVTMLQWIEKQNLYQIIMCMRNAFFYLQKASGKQTLNLQKTSFKKSSKLDPTKLDLVNFSDFDIKNQEQFLNLGYSLIHLVQCFQSVSTIDIEDLHFVIRISLSLSLTIFEIKNTESHLRLQSIILNMWLGYINLIEEQKQNKKQIIVIEQQICEEELLWMKISQVYDFAAYQFVNLQTEEKLFVCSPDEPLKKFINKMKNYACQLHLKLLKYESQTNDNLEIKSNTVSPTLFRRVIKTLSYFSIQKSMMEACSCKQFINSLLSLLIFISKENPEIIDANWANLLHLIVFPLLTMDEREFLNFDQEPEQFCRLAEDCCDKQHLGEIKTEAARFLQVICDRNQTYSQYVIQFCCLSLQSAVLKSQTKIDNSTALLPLEAAFLTLSVLSYNLSRFQLQISTIKSILLTPECLNLTQIEASRVFLFLAYNYSEIFSNRFEGKTWIMYAMNGKMHYTTKIAAYDFILNTIDEYFEEEFLLSISGKLNEDVQIRQVWQILNKLLNHHLQKVSESTMVKLIENILSRMSLEITKYKNRQIKTTANINSGLQLMRKILAFHNYTADKPQVLVEIYKVVPLYKTFKQLNLEDVILKIIYEFMNREQKIPPIFENMLPQMIEQFVQQDYRPAPFFWIWNQFIFKEQKIEKIKEIKSLLLEGVKFLHQSCLIDKRKTQNNLAIAHSFLILQHLLMLHGSKFNRNQIFEVYNLCQLVLPEDINEPQRLNIAPTVIGRILILMMICHMLVKDQQSLEGQKTNALKYLLLYHDEEGVFTGQNGQVMIKLLCKQLFRQSDIVSVTQMINIMVRILRPQIRSESHEIKSKKKSKNSLRFKIKSKQNFEMILKKVESPFDMKVNGQQQLKTTLKTMKENNQYLYKSIISYLPEQIKSKLRDLLLTNTIDNANTEKHRKIFKIGGVRKMHISDDEEEGTTKSRKRQGNFNTEEENQVFEEINENELILENNVESSQVQNDRKLKMKKSKLAKKLKKIEGEASQK